MQAVRDSIRRSVLARTHARASVPTVALAQATRGRSQVTPGLAGLPDDFRARAALVRENSRDRSAAFVVATPPTIDPKELREAVHDAVRAGRDTGWSVTARRVADFLSIALTELEVAQAAELVDSSPQRAVET